MISRLALACGLVALLAQPVSAQSVVLPIEGYFERQTVKGFGQLVDDAFHERNRAIFPNNGLQNQFQGYHAGVDVEYTAPADQAKSIPVQAIASGQVTYVGNVPGYGGLIIIKHAQPEAITSLYGHIRLGDRRVNQGDAVVAGQTVAFLGQQFSPETSGARRHLHFGIHKGGANDLAGHEPSLTTLTREWYNPNDWLQRFGAGSVLAVSPPRATQTATPRTEPTPLAPPDPPPAPSLWQKIIDFVIGLFL